MGLFRLVIALYREVYYYHPVIVNLRHSCADNNPALIVAVTMLVAMGVVMAGEMRFDSF